MKQRQRIKEMYYVLSIREMHKLHFIEMRHCLIAIVLLLNTGNLLAKNANNYPSLLTVFEYSDEIEEKAKKGDSNALWMLGMHNMPAKERSFLGQIVTLKDDNFSKQPNQEAAIKLIEKSAKKGNPIAMILMGKYEYLNPGKEKNLYKQAKECGKSAVKWYEKAMKSGYGDACALIYDIKKNYPNYKRILYDEKFEALEYLNKGISMKSPLSARCLGILYLQEPFDFKKAFDYFSLMEEWGAYSPYLTELYIEGKGCQRNYAEAIKRVEAHPKHHHFPSTYIKLVECFALGNGVKQDKEKAYYYLLKLPVGNQRLLYNNMALHLSCGMGFDEWIAQITVKAKHYEYTPTIFEEDRTTRFSDNIYLLKRGGVYFIINEKEEYLLHSLDTARIEGDSIVVMFDRYKSVIGHDGNMRNPIVNQMLVDWMQMEETSKEKSMLENWICSLDADGTYGIACILQNNKGVKAEKSYTPANYVYKKGHGINKKIGQSVSAAINKGNQNFHYSRALPFYERAAELNPDFEQAQMNVERMRKTLESLKNNETSPFMIGISSVLQLTNNLVQLRSQQPSPSLQTNKVWQGKNQKKVKQKSETAASAQNEMFNRNTYNDYVSQLIDMSTFRDRYDDNQRKSIQRSMKQIREKYGFPKSEWEDWNGK